MCTHKKQISILEKELNAVDSLHISAPEGETLSNQINVCPSNGQTCSMLLCL